MLIKSAQLEGIATGSVSVAFRRWRRPTVKAGGTLRTAIGVLAIDAVEAIDRARLSNEDARAAGYASLAALVAELDARDEGQIFRISLRLAGPDPRLTLREQGDVTAMELSRLREQLTRWDVRSAHGPWTLAVLRAVRAHEGLRAADLAARLVLPRDWLKIHVRKLKELGLTESLDVGYRISPRGLALLTSLEQCDDACTVARRG